LLQEICIDHPRSKQHFQLSKTFKGVF